MVDLFFKKVLILKECNAREIEVFAPKLREVSIKKGEVLFNQGDPGSRLFIVKEGTLACYSLLPNGSRRDVARFSLGKSFGEMAIVENKVRSTSCYALTDAKVLALEAVDFRNFTSEYPHIGVKILKGMLRNMVAWLSEADDFLTSMCIWGEKARLRAITDELTGLHNRRFFEEALDLNISKSKHKQTKFSLLMCDIDNFHNLNNIMGVQAGDEIIKTLAGVFKSSFTGSNIAAKVGGDEFAALLPGLSTREAMPIARLFKSSFEGAKIELNSTDKILKGPITISVGIAEYPLHGETSMALKKAADKALFNAKKAGKNTIICAEKY